MRAQHRDHPRIETDRAPTRSRLRIGLAYEVRHAHPRPTHRKHTRVEVDITPPQPGQLAAAHPRREHQHPQRVQTIIDHRAEEPPRLIRTPRPHLGRLMPRRLHPQERAPHEQTPQHRVVQRLPQHPVHDGDRCRRQLGPSPTTTIREQLGVQTPDEERVEVYELHSAEPRLDVPLHHLPIALRGRRLQRRHVPGEPLVEIRANGDLTGVGHLARADRRQRSAQRLLRLALGREAALPPLAPATRDRIATDVDDITPRVPALDDTASHPLLHKG